MNEEIEKILDDWLDRSEDIETIGYWIWAKNDFNIWYELIIRHGNCVYGVGISQNCKTHSNGIDYKDPTSFVIDTIDGAKRTYETHLNSPSCIILEDTTTKNMWVRAKNYYYQEEEALKKRRRTR